MDHRRDYRGLVLEYGRGGRQAGDLPTEDRDFWNYVIRLSARPGRQSNKAPFIGAAADQLLRGQLHDAASHARKTAALGLLDDPNPRVRKVAVDQLLKPGAKASPEMVWKAVFSRDKEVAVQALHVIGRRPSDEACEVLCRVLSRTTDIRATVAAQELIRLGAKSLPYLQGLLDSPDRNVRWQAVSCIVAIDGDESLPGLLNALHDDSADVAWLAADGLLALGPSVRACVLRSVLGQHLSVATARALRHYAEHSAPKAVFKGILDATHGLASLSAIPLAVSNALAALEESSGPARHR